MVSAMMAAAQCLELELMWLLRRSKLNPWQHSTHFYDNAHNLSENATMKGCVAIKDSFKTCFELVKPI